ncbi:hypothetical protein [Wolbachia endosymbiont of Atemnus politus]|uniref:hypothetical protein n=1 Tax=Wolbachia endosymbiont of Atemnus politus TaxID=2682840 RepID=UPI001572FF82|nr:hypothetical protein [Wolbachia endosymbiont of Atemnus politus]
MRTPKKIGKAIVKKLKNWKGKPTPTASASNSKDFLEEPEKLSEDILSVKTTIEQQIPYPTATTDTAINIETTTCNNSNTTIEDPDASSTTLIVEAKEITAQEPNTPANPSPAEPCSGSGKGNSMDEKSSKRSFQPIIAGIVGVLLLASGAALYIMKMPVVAVVVRIVGLVCMSFALYYVLKPNTKLEKVADVEQYIIQSSLNPI